MTYNNNTILISGSFVEAHDSWGRDEEMLFRRVPYLAAQHLATRYAGTHGWSIITYEAVDRVLIVESLRPRNKYDENKIQLNSKHHW